ncbi:nucleoside/nucleotide kinase family protein [Tichowtungia aerotolerans]|uniref:Uncharacterized protein n=1 Tax=Tichowtungia aerotolerans TaxID=2697043 RepID=A0A6P1MAR4_9BACT|nr:hypothetical protein [Tichowtungia aerotolerans]QHI70193.1 hypothetical protein GT409_12330 [Tichowtungia aerotolerans]
MDVESKKLIEILDVFDAKDIAYVLVGEDAQALADQVQSDVDIVVRSSDLSNLHSNLLKISSFLGAQLVQVLQHEACAFYYVVSWRENDRELYLRLDVCSDYVRNARRFLTADEMLAGRRKDVATGFYFPAPEKNLLYYLLKKIDKGAINDEQFAYLLKNLAASESDVLPELRRFWAEDQSKQIFQCLDHKDRSGFQAMIPMLQQSLRAQCRPSIKSRAQDVARMCKRILQPTGVWVAVLGPDGCGKSSVIDLLLPRLEPAFRRTGLMHFRPKVGYRGPADQSHAADPHNQPDRSVAGSILKLGYYTADYIIGYFLKVLPARIRSTFIVFDRYYDDLLVDRKRYCYGGPVWLLKAVRPFISKPDLVFCLDAPAEVLRSRKQEVPFEVTARQRTAYRELVSKLRNGHVIDASQPLEKVVHDVESVVLDFMERRTAKRMH